MAVTCPHSSSVALTWPPGWQRCANAECWEHGSVPPPMRSPRAGRQQAARGWWGTRTSGLCSSLRGQGTSQGSGQGTGSSFGAGVGGLGLEVTWGVFSPRDWTASPVVAAKMPILGRAGKQKGPLGTRSSVHTAERQKRNTSRERGEPPEATFGIS